MQSTHPARVFFLVARKINKAIVFRRGPTKWTQMIVWDLNTDKLEYGQWSTVKFQKWRCDLSPSGKYLIYLNDQFEEDGSATVISKPPYWTAITKWEHYNPLFGIGGGVFNSENELVLNWHYMLDAHPLFPVSPQLKVSHKEQTFDVEKHRLKRDGWKLIDSKEFIANALKTQEKLETTSLFWDDISKVWYDSVREQEYTISPELWVKSITKKSSLYRLSYYHYEQFKRLNKFYVKRKKSLYELKDLEWAELDKNGRIIASRNGTLLASKRLKNGSIIIDELELLHDLNPQKPIKIPVPDNINKWG